MTDHLRKLQAIPTCYRETKFRSRIEARWAVYLDLLRIEWEYEPETYDLRADDGTRVLYCPDFRLIGHLCFLEVKPGPGDITKGVIRQLHALSAASEGIVLVTAGAPNLEWPLRIYEPDWTGFLSGVWDPFSYRRVRFASCRGCGATTLEGEYLDGELLHKPIHKRCIDTPPCGGYEDLGQRAAGMRFW
jgi:hypothetical protein